MHSRVEPNRYRASWARSDESTVHGRFVAGLPPALITGTLGAVTTPRRPDRSPLTTGHYRLEMTSSGRLAPQ